MKNRLETAHPYMANSVPAIKEAMLRAIGVATVEELFEQIPAEHRLKSPLDLPPALPSESELRRHVLDHLRRNETCEDNLSFIGGGCWQHHVPAVCDEIAGRAEMMTSVWGTPYSDHGRNQAWFEFASLLGELVGCEVVGQPVYSWGYAAGHAIRMAARLTGRRRVLLPRLIDPERLSVIRNLCEPKEMTSHIDIVEIGFDARTGLLDLADLEAKLSEEAAAVYFDCPSHLGLIESHGAEIAALARCHGAEVIVGADPISLGVLEAPPVYGADIVVGPMQPLGIHMNTGGGVGGFIATRDEARYVHEYPTLLISLARTPREEWAFALSCAHQTSYGLREEGKDWTGNSVNNWAIVNAVYLSLMGPAGMRELGELILQRANYAARELAAIDGVALRFSGPLFKEFVLDYAGTGKSVAAINEGLRRHGIFGGRGLGDLGGDLGSDFETCALTCVTEIHSQADIDRFAEALAEEAAR